MLEENKNIDNSALHHSGDKVFKLTEETIFTVHNVDARNIDQIINDQIVDVTITSPPYFDLKDYGHHDQIGYGQKYDHYLEDLKLVFSKVYNITKDTGSLWVVIDSFKRDGEIVPLPFDFSAKLKEVGWKLQDIIIWHKDKTIPWVNGGTTRGIFEYVLLFTKTTNYKYFTDKVRNYDDLKKWWVKYPERYHPKGKSLDEVWHYPIPVQGTWGNGYIRHFCPLPEGLVDRILTLTTNENDVVLDPFSGSGTVPAQALFRNRKHIGFELNKEYIQMFHSYVDAHMESKRSELSQEIHKLRESNAFEELMLNLRALKLARVIKKELLKNDINVLQIYVNRSAETPTDSKKFSKVYFKLLVSQSNLTDKAISVVASSSAISKFRLEIDLQLITDETAFILSLPEGSLYMYSDQNTHKYKLEADKNAKLNSSIISQIKINLNENDYE